MTDPSTPTLPPPPRPVSRRASRRSWNERPVRVWLLSLLVVAGATGYFLVERVGRAKYERDLIFNGTRVNATIAAFEGSSYDRTFARERGPQVTLRYTPAGATQPVTFDDRLTPGIPGTLRVGGTLEIRVDPDDPNRWTDRTEPRPWSAELTVVYGLAPLLVVLSFLVLVARVRVLSAYRHGQETSGTVIDAKHSSIAPMSRVVRFVLNDSDDKRVYSTLCPAGAVPAPGEPIGLIVPPKNPGRALVKELYADPAATTAPATTAAA
jgi:hypothetical protein